MKTLGDYTRLAILVLGVLWIPILYTSSQENPVGRQVGPDGKPLVKPKPPGPPKPLPEPKAVSSLTDEQKAAIIEWAHSVEPAPIPDPIVVPVQADKWTQLWIAFAASLPVLLPLIAVFINSIRNTGKISALHHLVIGDNPVQPIPMAQMKAVQPPPMLPPEAR